jgi:hypothetical protein
MWTCRPLSREAARIWIDPATTSTSSRPNLGRNRLRVRPAQSVVRGFTLALLGLLLVSLAACGRSAAASSPSSDTRNLPSCQDPCLDQGNGGAVTTTGPNAAGSLTTNSGGNPQAGGSSLTTVRNAATVTTAGQLPACKEPCDTQPDGSPLTTDLPPEEVTSTTQLPPCQAPCGTQPDGNPITSTSRSEPPPQDETTATDAPTGSSEP